jgi:large subunit ribosomal protein L31
LAEPKNKKIMKKDIHPQTNKITIECSCGTKFVVNSTLKWDTRVEICSSCHPFYTGEQKILKTGAVDKFYARMKKAEELKKKAAK